MVEALRAGGAGGVKLARALMTTPTFHADAEIAELAAGLLVKTLREPRPPALPPKFLSDPESGKRIEIQGYALLFGAVSMPLETNRGGAEVILPDAILARTDLRQMILTVDHNYDAPVRGKLEIALDPSGLLFRLSNIPNTAGARDVASLFARGLVSGCSFTAQDILGKFIKLNGEWVFGISSIKAITEIAVVTTNTLPVYPDPCAWLSTQGNLAPRAATTKLLWDWSAPSRNWITCHGR